MQNLIAFFIFQITSLGIVSLFSPLFKFKFDRDKIGTAIFWGFWGAMLLTYLFALIIPKHLNIVCYLVFIVSLFGIGKLVNERKILEIFKSDYAYCLLFLIPFVLFLVHMPSTCDEYGHWVLLPKIFCETNELVTAAVTSGPGYTPLWVLQAAFFEFFIPGNFSESVIAVIQMGVFVSFLFFLKETLNIKAFFFLIFSFLILFITSKFTKHLLVEFPLYILITSLSFLVYSLEKIEEDKEAKNLLFFLLMGALSLYMVKKSMIAIFPSIIWYLWVKNYKKELFSFLLVFFFFAISWKIKNYEKSELLVPGQTINSFSSSDAFLVYSIFIEKIKENFAYFITFAGSLYLIYRNSRRLFIFYSLFSIIFISALVTSYLFSFHKIEAVALASFLRYMTSIFYPAYTLALYILFSKASEKMDAQEGKIGPKGALLGLALLSFAIGGSFVYQGYKESKRDFVGHLVAKIHPSHIPQNANVLVIGSQFYWRFHYHLYPSDRKLHFCSLKNLPYNELNTFLSNYNLVVVQESNEELNKFFITHWGIDGMGQVPFYLYKMNNKMELKKL
jgi:hypothetical protein